MTGELQTLVAEAAELTGSAPPALLDADAPVLQMSASPRSIYLIGLIGGKEVGKSSLVNALVGQPISERADSGPGTEQAIAYVHRAAAAELKSLLDSIVPGAYRIVPHDVGRLQSQVLVDLPDIDSHWTAHVTLTRQMLRHMLYPLWLQSVEKYADRQPQQLLQQVAAGNDPRNFLFCLNKCDQLTPADAARLASDYSERLRQTLSIPHPPQVYLVSATRPDSLDFPALRSTLADQKSTAIVAQSQQLAGRRQDASLVRWLDGQQLSARLERGQRLYAEAQELVAQRIGIPLLEQSIRRLTDDPGYRWSLTEPAVQARLSRWPVVNVLHTAMLPLTSLVRRNIGEKNPDTLLRVPAIRSTFALLHQSHPAIGSLYQSRKLWEDQPAEIAEAELRERIATAMDRQRDAAAARVSRRSVLYAPLRWLATIGAVIWFPIVQPILQAALAPGWTGISREAGYLAVQLLSAAYLLKTIGFLVLYFAVLWAWLRFDTHRRINRFLARLSGMDADVDLSLTGQAVAWMDGLLDPLKADVERAGNLAARVEQFRKQAGTK